MPQEWVDNELKGAEALAYRLDLDVYGTKCGYFSNVENCRPATLALICCQKHKPHPAPTYIADRVWFCDKDKQVYH
jgi:hypothetical protein